MNSKKKPDALFQGDFVHQDTKWDAEEENRQRSGEIYHIEFDRGKGVWRLSKRSLKTLWPIKVVIVASSDDDAKSYRYFLVQGQHWQRFSVSKYYEN